MERRRRYSERVRRGRERGRRTGKRSELGGEGRREERAAEPAGWREIMRERSEMGGKGGEGFVVFGRRGANAEREEIRVDSRGRGVLAACSKQTQPE